MQADDGGSSGSRSFIQLDSLVQQGSVSSNCIGYEGLGGPGAFATALESWKRYGGIMSEEHNKMVKTLTLEKKAKDDFTVVDAQSNGQMEFCLEKLIDVLERLESLESLRDSESTYISKSGVDLVPSRLGWLVFRPG